MENEFVKKTIEILNLGENDPLIAPNGFDIVENDTKEEYCVLVIGLNPAGDEEDAKREKDCNNTYFYGIDSRVGFSKKWMYKPYYLPILRFVESIVDDKVKWPWCGKPWSVLEQELRMDITFPQESVSSKAKETAVQAIKGFFAERQASKFTIYIGDMFYFHKTKSKKLPLAMGKGAPDYKKYCTEMLEDHIRVLRNHNKTVSFVYVNNAQVSHFLCGDDDKKTMLECLGVKVFLGGMLSGQRSMDSFSTQRLIQEIPRVSL